MEITNEISLMSKVLHKTLDDLQRGNKELQQEIIDLNSEKARLISQLSVGDHNQSFSNGIIELAIALSKAQGMMTGAKKDANNPYFNSKYADLASCWEALREPLSKNGLSVIQLDISKGDGNVSILTRLMHVSGQWAQHTVTLTPAKKDPQGIGSTKTYCRRYGLMDITGLAPEEDDGNDASHPQRGTTPLHNTNSAPAKKPDSEKKITKTQYKALIVKINSTDWPQDQALEMMYNKFGCKPENMTVKMLNAVLKNVGVHSWSQMTGNDPVNQEQEKTESEEKTVSE